MKQFRCLLYCIIVLSVSSVYSQPITRFAAIGDYGRWYTEGEALVSQLVHSWNPDFIITLGDNNYEYGADSTIDSNIGQFYHDYIFPYTGNFGEGSPFNRFFPSLGNHDFYSDTARTYLNYFVLPGNERYYDYIRGNCHFFVINSDPIEPDGNTVTSVQALWLKNKLAQSNSRFKIVYFHHPPFSSGQHGNNADMNWKFKQWGATVVLCGHEHNYERLVDNTGMTYFINGLGGKDWREFAAIVSESRFRFTGNYGAMLVTSYPDSLNLKFIAYPDSVKDDTTIVLPPIGIQPISEIASEFKLEQNFPNPFNPVTHLRFRIADFGFVTLNIYDVSGSIIESMVNHWLQPGTYEVQWDASVYSSGIYFYSLSSSYGTITKKMILIK
ncbi:MAG: T9SS type A sorting domain-containing protein [Ignavibacteria bacterium]|nr:T9SS type A sorting domain-containing protein [Ignavibacteria bacterium]